MTQRVLIVDDDPIQRRLLEAMISKMGHKVTCAEGGEQALDLLERQAEPGFSLIFLDLVMPEVDGMEMMSRMAQKGLHVPTIVQTAQGGIETAVRAMRAGAFDFVVKPVSPERVQVAIANALKVGEKEVARLKAPKKKSGTLTFDDLVGSSASMENVIRIGKKSAASNIPVLIEGESGVGKEMIARAIQGNSDRSGKPFVTVNCGALPENLVESILFGHEKGAFTGANEKHIGKFQEANGGTLFLDEVGELPLDVQVKLLRAIQEGEVDPVGARKSVKVDIRLISATNRNLLEEVSNGRFREDLYYRLNVFPLSIPPLRERREEIADLAKHFTRKIAAEEGREAIQSVDKDALKLLHSYDWPGNIRQLENAIFRAVVLCDGDQLTLDEFPQIAAQVKTLGTRIDLAVPEVPVTPKLDSVELSDLKLEERETPSKGLVLTDENGDIYPLEYIEKEAIRQAIEHYGGQMSKIARQLGIGRSTLYRKLRDYGLEEATKSENDG